MNTQKEKQLDKELNSKEMKDQVGDIAKKVLKKLYKDLSFHHPYIIDRIKVWYDQRKK